ncbi:CSC1-like protein RXW8 isoform X5 [Durio zibethinus]|uniref:CSC1-like protein RXW8 isoform X5 n=1 Tax=Durio zibethinus TaxID=66656 RepID=A0A6P5X707_DURZI|nr:CSC1-like protein RXW8 isoform X5 [Durio zibethinus]
MDITALLTSAGINIAICVVLLSLYSVLRKQPSNGCVYFTQRLVSEPVKYSDPFCLERLVPSASWIMRVWQATDEDILAVGGVDAVVFMRIVVFSIRVFIIAAMICIFLVLPVNYYGQDMQHKQINAESLEVFTIGNVKEGSKWLWTHCLALYIISCSACVLLYFEYKSITKMRLAHITGSPPSPSHFTVLVRGIPWSPDHSYSDSVEKFFSTYYPASYVSHQMVYQAGTIDKLMKDAEKMYRMLKTIEPQCGKSSMPCCLCGGTTHSFKVLNNEAESVKSKTSVDGLQPTQREKERPAAFVFFRTRYAAVIAAQVLQSSNPMLWVTQLAPEPHDVYWSNLSIPYKQVWLRKIATLLGAIVFMLVFLVPVTFVQGLTQLDQLSHTFPFLKGILKQKYMNHLVTGYLPSVILILFLYAVPPTMMLFSAMEGNVSRSERKRSACIKILYFTIWNVFFVNVLSGSVISQLSVFSSVRDIPIQLAKAVPAQATFFTTYVLSSGWASLSCEILHVYVSKYESGGQFWPIVHNTTIFSLVLTQIIALGVFGIKRSPIASGFTIPLIFFTVLFNEYCRQRFSPVFKRSPAQVLIEMDRQDERWGTIEEIYNQLRSAYCQYPSISPDLSTAGNTSHHEDKESSQDPESLTPGNQLVKLNE